MDYDLHERLIRFSVSLMGICESLPDSRITNHLRGQLIRCGTAPALLYSEAQSAESLRDFVHKMRISLKELRESFAILKIIDQMNFLIHNDSVGKALSENDQLIAIFVTSVKTAEKNMGKRK